MSRPASLVSLCSGSAMPNQSISSCDKCSSPALAMSGAPFPYNDSPRLKAFCFGFTQFLAKQPDEAQQRAFNAFGAQADRRQFGDGTGTHTRPIMQPEDFIVSLPIGGRQDPLQARINLFNENL